jgi:REP element-mobilizing transposase RayT
MPKPRHQLVDESATQFYHCISRVVRRAFLCGIDPLTGYNFDHRKGWIAGRLKELVDIFAVDICSYGLMSNHFHLILHTDSARARTWSDEDVTQRYERLFPHAVADARELPAEAWAKKVRLWRERLPNLSWFMRCLNESIARRANREDNCTGHFWEGRFRSQALLDEGALLTCMAYVDLNPVRAGLASTPEEAQFTSIRERLLSAARAHSVPPGLMPFADQAAPDSESLPVCFKNYEEIVRFAAESVRGDQDLPVPAAVATSLERHGLESSTFIDTLRNYPRRFFTMVGHSHRIDMESTRRGYKRRPSMAAASRMYRNTG